MGLTKTALFGTATAIALLWTKLRRVRKNACQEGKGERTVKEPIAREAYRDFLADLQTWLAEAFRDEPELKALVEAARRERKNDGWEFILAFQHGGLTFRLAFRGQKEDVRLKRVALEFDSSVDWSSLHVPLPLGERTDSSISIVWGQGNEQERLCKAPVRDVIRCWAGTPFLSRGTF